MTPFDWMPNELLYKNPVYLADRISTRLTVNMAKAENKPTRRSVRTNASRSARKVKKADHGFHARPALLYTLALASAIAAGAFSIRAIHDGTPELTGFDRAGVVTTERHTQPVDVPQIPAAVDLMKTQGWIAPASLEIHERERRRSEWPPEIAAIEETVIDTEVVRPEGDGYLPPPPMDTNGGQMSNFAANGDELNGLQPGDGELFAPTDAAVVEGNNTMSVDGNAPASSTDNIGSMIAGINRAGQTSQPQAGTATEPASETNPVTLVQLQISECSRLGFISRVSCQDRVRQTFCKGRWNEINECIRKNEEGDF